MDIQVGDVFKLSRNRIPVIRIAVEHEMEGQRIFNHYTKTTRTFTKEQEEQEPCPNPT